ECDRCRNGGAASLGAHDIREGVGRASCSTVIVIFGLRGLSPSDRKSLLRARTAEGGPGWFDAASGVLHPPLPSAPTTACVLHGGVDHGTRVEGRNQRQAQAPEW